MHKAIKKAIKAFRDKYWEDISDAKIAELGALNINGSPRDYLPIDVGFDLVEGPGIDVKIEPGIIPEEHVGKYDIVISSSSFHYCPKPELYKKQILDLLKVGGMLWMSMCGPSCKRNHTTSDNKQGFKDCFRLTAEQLMAFMGPEIETVYCHYAGDDHHQDIIYLGQKTDKTLPVGETSYSIPASQFR